MMSKLNQVVAPYPVSLDLYIAVRCAGTISYISYLYSLDLLCFIYIYYICQIISRFSNINLYMLKYIVYHTVYACLV